MDVVSKLLGLSLLVGMHLLHACLDCDSNGKEENEAAIVATALA